MNEVSIIQSDNIMEIISLGEDISSKLQSNTNQIIGTMDRALRQNDNSIVKSIDKILSKIDISELSSFNNRKSGLNGIIDRVRNVKKQIEEKYTSILKELGQIESTVLLYKSDLKDINSMLKNSKENIESASSELLILREHLFNEVDRVNSLEKSIFNEEKLSILNQKINDINLKLQNIKQMSDSIDIVSKTNYNTYKKMMTVYDTTIPMIEMQLSIKSITVHHRLLAENVKYLNDKNNELIISTANEIIKSGEEAIQLLGDTSNFEALKSAKKMIEDGKLMLERKQSEEILKIQNNIKTLQLVGGRENVNLIN